MELFDAFTIKVVPKEENSMDNALAIAVASLQPCEELIYGECTMEILFRPYVPNNFEHSQVFRDDTQIIRFLNNLQEFSKNQVNWQGEDERETIRIEDFPNNRIPRRVVLLERMFNRHDMYKDKQ